MSTRLYHRRVRILTIISDLFLVNVAFMLAYVQRYELQWLRPVTFFQPYEAYLGQQLLFTLIITLVFWQTRVWVRRRGEFWIDEVLRIIYGTAAAIALMVILTFFLQPLVFSRLLLGWLLLDVVILLGLSRLLRRYLLALLYRRGRGVDNVLVVGSGEVARGVIRTFLARPDLGFRAIGYLDDEENGSSIGSGRIPRLGSWAQLGEVLQARPEIHSVFIALPASMHELTTRLVRQCQKAKVQALVVPDLFELSLSRVEFTNMAGIPTFRVRDLRISRWGQLLKRMMDVGVVLLLAMPAFFVSLILAIAIKLDSPGPVFYNQTRVGKDGRLFKMIKFRSMVADADQKKEALLAMNEADGPIFKMKADPRRTRVGRFLRRTSLDELPQLINVLRGEMSLVGPRPPLPEEVAAYQPWHHQRLSVRGGITGLWQVSGRSDLTFDEQCLLDIYYIENWSLSFDLRLLLQTIPHSLFGRGAY